MTEEAGRVAAAGGATPRLREVIEKLKHDKGIRELISEIRNPRTGYNKALRLSERLREELGIPVYLDEGYGAFSGTYTYCSEREPVVLVINIDLGVDASWWLEVCSDGYRIVAAEEVYLDWGED